MKPRYEPFTRTAQQRRVCPKCKDETTKTVLINRKDFTKMLYDPFLKHTILNVEMLCATCKDKNA